MIHRFDIAPVPLDIEKYLHFVHNSRAVAVNGGHAHPNIERSGLVRVIACAPVARIATSRVSLPRRFYSSSSYCQTPSRTAQSSTPYRLGNLSANLDLTRNLNAIACPYLSTHSVSLNLCPAIAMTAALKRSIPRFSAPKGQRHCTLRGVRRVGPQERASRQSRKSTDLPSGSKTRTPGGWTHRRGWNVAGAPGRPRYGISYPKSTKSLISKGKL
jgi:hypothetical protein